MKQIFSLFLLVLLLSSAFAQQDITTSDNPASLLMGYRAARLDGLRLLAEQVKGLKISSSTSVKDFVTESDKIDSCLLAFMAGAQDAAPPVFNLDGTCQVKLVLDIRVLIGQMQSMAQKYGSQQDFSAMAAYNPQQAITVTGNGAISSKTFPKFVGWGMVRPQGKLMAKRAAQMDAMRNLAEVVLGVQIASNTSVQDFVAQRDEIRTKFSHYMHGARFGKAEYFPNGIVRLRAWMDYPTVMANQRRLYASTRQYPPIEFPQGQVEVYGFGVCPPRFYNYIPIAPPAVEPSAPVAPQEPAWTAQMYRVTGNGAIDTQRYAILAQAKLMGYRAACMDGYRKILEYVKGLRLDSKTTVKDFITESDEINSRTNGWIKGARQVAVRYNEDGTVDVDFEVDLALLWKFLGPAYRAKKY